METKDFCRKMRELLDLMEDSCKDEKDSKKDKKEDYSKDSKDSKKGDVDNAVKIIKLSLGR